MHYAIFDSTGNLIECRSAIRSLLPPHQAFADARLFSFPHLALTRGRRPRAHPPCGFR